MIKRRPFLLLLLFSVWLTMLIVPSASAQTKQTEEINQTWLGYLNQTRLSDKWGFWLDGHLRTKEKLVTDLSSAIVRVGLTYYLKDDLKLTAAYAFINFYPTEGHTKISQPEHRPWQQLQWHTKYPKMRVMQWLRLEERFRRKVLNDSTLGSGYNFNFRTRYNLLAQWPIGKKYYQPGTFSFVISDEVLIAFGKKVVYNYFDQNRFFTGFNYHLNPHAYLQAGYSNVFSQLPAGNKYRTLHVARLFYFHNLDLRRKKK